MSLRPTTTTTTTPHFAPASQLNQLCAKRSSRPEGTEAWKLYQVCEAQSCCISTLGCALRGGPAEEVLARSPLGRGGPHREHHAVALRRPRVILPQGAGLAPAL